MSESCNSRHFSWLVKSCLPNPSDAKSLVPINHPSPAATTVASLPDDLLLECLSRVPSSSISSLSAVCRRWSRLLLSPYFFHLRRRHGLLRHSLFAFSAVDSGLFAADLQLNSEIMTWKVYLAVSSSSDLFDGGQGSLSHARAAAIGPRVYVVGKNAVLRYDSWMGTLSLRSPMIFPRKKFAIAVISGKIYVAGGGSGSEVAAAVEEYDPERNRWEVVTQASRKRYGCIGAAVDGVFYVIGGLKIGNETSRGSAHVYASSMDLFDVKSRQWLRSRSVPGGGCVVAACAAVGHVYVLSSHAVELSFWRFDARRGGGGFGEWIRLRSPPLPAQVRLDGTVRFSCVGVEDKVAVVQVVGCIDDLLRRSGRSERGLRESLVLLYDTADGEWRRAADLPEVITRAACACVEW
ncbi:unnamed protein product [Cochlearia groenlandica]